MAIEVRSLAGNFFVGHELMQMPPKFLAGMPGHAAADPHGEMVAAWERPQIALETVEEFHADSLGLRGHEITERHFHVAARQRTRVRQQGIARSRGDDNE